MFERLAAVAERYAELERMLADPAVAEDYRRVVELSKERAALSETVANYHEYERLSTELRDARQLSSEAEDAEMRALADLEVESLQDRLHQLTDALRKALIPRDPRDQKNVIVEIRAGAGGDEAGIFAADLFRMYTRYAERRGWQVNLLDLNETGIGGFKSVIFSIAGEGAYSQLKYESGVHRVQRVPVTESQGRIHTSTATVAVLAEMEEVDVELNRNDLRVDVFRSRGAGGQSVNTTDSAVRLTHLPTGIVVEMQDERSQLQNRIRAQQVLIARLYEQEMEQQRAERDELRRGQVGSGDRAEKIRTYNYPQGRVTDHRISLSEFNLPEVMDGSIDTFIDALSLQEQQDSLAEGA
ncbi:MAG: peptide chain release factor 1 [Chloroflexi bacterium]|nr:peptide chain release factor 1 [Chloroflexota bacterium]